MHLGNVYIVESPAALPRAEKALVDMSFGAPRTMLRLPLARGVYLKQRLRPRISEPQAVLIRLL
jgi:hypothetical protein